ncbi:MAG: TsoY family (seleno)protein [Halochromatium sp.]|uniref:TsoY family (seleno)protein n=1 Tax=Halochromatium sp. TaxID=2049430 RepID=UPI00397E15C0
MSKTPQQGYHPLYFLAALGAGGLTVTFFLYFMFLVPHPETPVVTADDLIKLWATGADWVRPLIILGIAGMLAMAVMHLRLLIWNLLQYRRWRREISLEQLQSGNKDVALMTIPLTLTMTINVLFAVGAATIPGLWSIAEYLFPGVLAVLIVLGAFALRMYGRYLARLVVTGSFDFIGNANLGQMMPIFAFAMIAVAFAAPGAMSQNQAINAIGLFFAIFFLSLAALLGLVKLVVGVNSMFRHGLTASASPSLWILIPILTLSGITLVRLIMGLHHGFDLEVPKPALFVLTSVVLSLEILFGLLGYVVMRRLGYFRDYLHGEQKSPGAYSLICPGVAFFVFGWFWIMFGLVGNDIVTPLTPVFFVLMVPLILVQWKSLETLLKLNRKLLRKPAPPHVVI